MRKFACLILIAISFILCACSVFQEDIKTISQLAYDSNNTSNNEIYILENGEYVPYLVLTEDYEGNTLILRKEIMITPKRFNDYMSLYENSEIDIFLNTEYLEMLSDDVQDKVVSVDIEVTSKESLNIGGKDIYKIMRKAFLLSFTEVGYYDHAMAPVEGKTLKYFDDISKRVAVRGNEPYSWWLRTPYTAFETVSWSVGGDGAQTELSVEYVNGIRPALCLPSDMDIHLSDDIVSGKEVYILGKGEN